MYKYVNKKPEVYIISENTDKFVVPKLDNIANNTEAYVYVGE